MPKQDQAEDRGKAISRIRLAGILDQLSGISSSVVNKEEKSFIRLNQKTLSGVAVSESDSLRSGNTKLVSWSVLGKVRNLILEERKRERQDKGERRNERDKDRYKNLNIQRLEKKDIDRQSYAGERKK